MRRHIRRNTTKKLCFSAEFYVESGGDLLSRAVTSQVPSALKGLTSVFGMGTGGTPSSLPPEMVSYESETAFHSVFRLPVPRFRKFRPADRPFLPPSGLKVFSHPDNCTVSIQCKDCYQLISESRFCNQALDRLVSSSCMRYRTSTDDLSTR